MEKKENYYIDFIRFLCGFVIMCFHSWVFTNGGGSYFVYGYLAVNFYFILTGYLMMNSLNKRKDETYLFILGKFKRLFPGLILAFVVSYAFAFGRSGFSCSSENLIRLFSNDLVGDLLMLKTFGYGGVVNATWWYMSAMLFVLAIVYPLAKKYGKQYITYIAPMIILITLAITRFYEISFKHHSETILIFSNGFFKGLIYICLGNISYELAKIIKLRCSNKKELITIIEIFLTIVMIYEFYKGIIGTVIFALFLLLLVSISFSGISLTNKVFKHKIWKYLGNYSFYLYLVHEGIRQYYLRHNTYIYSEMFKKYALTSIVFAFIIFLILDIIFVKIKKYLLNKNKQKSYSK